MATRSTIALEFADGTVGQIYCHWDGSLAHNGKILLNHYMDPFKVRQLIDLGTLSSLRPEIGQEHKFNGTDNGNWCLFYGRDGKVAGLDVDFDTTAHYFTDYEHFLVDGGQEEYDYILRQVDGKAVWYVSDHGGDFQPLMEAFVEELRQQNEEAVVQ